MPSSSPPDQPQSFVIHRHHSAGTRLNGGAVEAQGFDGSHDDVFAHQHDVDDEERRIKQNKAAQGEDHLRSRHRRRCQKRRQYAVDRPRLTAILGDHPAEFGGDPRQRQRPDRQPQQPSARKIAMRGVPEQQRKEGDEVKAEPHHDAEAPEQRKNVWNGTGGGLGDGRVVGLAWIVDITLEHLRSGRGLPGRTLMSTVRLTWCATCGSAGPYGGGGPGVACPRRVSCRGRARPWLCLCRIWLIAAMWMAWLRRRLLRSESR